MTHITLTKIGDIFQLLKLGRIKFLPDLLPDSDISAG